MAYMGSSFWMIVRRGPNTEVQYLGLVNGSFVWNTVDIFLALTENAALDLVEIYGGTVEKIAFSVDGVRVHGSLQ